MQEIYQILFFASPLFLGMGFGIVYGILPGLSTLFAVISAMPLLYHFSALQIILFYLALQISINYSGNISATFFGIPGEPNSVPATKTAYRLYKKGYGREALVMAAGGSMVATFLAVIVIYSFFPLLKEQNWIYSVKINFIIYSMIMFYLIFINKNFLSNIFLIFLGLFLGSIGAKGYYYNSLTFGQSWLQTGIDTQLLILFSFVIPTLLSNLQNNVHNNIEQRDNKKIKKIFNIKKKYLLLKYKAACLRGSLIGMLTGIIPAIGTTISSQLSYALEKKISSKIGNHLVSAESANNSAGVSCLVPILMLGIPILASEAIIIQLIQGKGIPIGFEYFSNKEFGMSRLEYLCISAVIVSIIMYIFSTRFAHHISKILFYVPGWILIYVLPSILTIILLFDSVKYNTLPASILTILISIPIAIHSIKKKIDTIPLVFSFLLSQNIIESSNMIIGLIQIKL